jgi:hypothetical protein
MAVARRFGVTSKTGLAAAAFGGNLPDMDIPAGWVLRRNVHRQGTHTANFAVMAGAAAGFLGALRAESVEGERDLVRDTLAGAAIVGTHLVLDRIPYFPKLKFGPRYFGLPLVNWFIDTAEWAVVAYLIWPRQPQPSSSAATS